MRSATTWSSPYNVYGGLQDNGSQRGPSTMKGGGSIPFEAWYRVGGGDGMYNVVDPDRLAVALQREPVRRDPASRSADRAVALDPLQPSAGAGRAAVELDVTDPAVAAQSRGRVSRRERAAPVAEPRRVVDGDQPRPHEDTCPSGATGPATSSTRRSRRSTSRRSWPGCIWAGTDDGNVQVTRDGGKTWTDVTDEDRRPSRLLGEPCHRVAPRRGHRVRDGHGIPARRLQAVRLEDDRLRRDVDVDCRQSAETKRST